jgi:hypothetical protein
VLLGRSPRCARLDSPSVPTARPFGDTSSFPPYLMGYPNGPFRARRSAPANPNPTDAWGIPQPLGREHWPSGLGAKERVPSRGSGCCRSANARCTAAFRPPQSHPPTCGAGLTLCTSTVSCADTIVIRHLQTRAVVCATQPMRGMPSSHCFPSNSNLPTGATDRSSGLVARCKCSL